MSNSVKVNIKGKVIEVPMTDDINTAINIFISKEKSILEGISSENFSTFTFIKLAINQLQELELIKVCDDQYYLAPQMYIASMKYNELVKSPLAPIYNFFSYYLKASRWDFGYDFNAFSNSNYYSEKVFREYFSPKFNKEMVQIREGGKTSLEESKVIESEGNDEKFMHLINREMDSWKVQAFKN